jgi:hypothetical protein
MSIGIIWLRIQVAGIYKRDNKLSSFIKDRQFIEQLGRARWS